MSTDSTQENHAPILEPGNCKLPSTTITIIREDEKGKL